MILVRIKTLLLNIIESAIRNISGGFGEKIRYFYYKRRFNRCGSDVRIGIGVIFEGAEFMNIGDFVWINHYSHLIAGNNITNKNRVIRTIDNPDFIGLNGWLTIGSESGIGSFSTIHAFGGGISIDEKVTLSSGVKIFSFSHHYRDEKNPSLITYASSTVQDSNVSCVSYPTVINKGAWLGLNVICFGGTIGMHAFAKANSVVMGYVPPNTIVCGDPACVIGSRFHES